MRYYLSAIMPSKLLWLCIILFVIGSGDCADIPFVFGGGSSDIADYSSDQLVKASAASLDLEGVPAIYSPSDSEVLEFPVAGGGSESTGTARKVVGELKETLTARVEPENAAVRHEAVVLAARYSGDHSIDQISSIYGYLKGGAGETRGWSYVPDPRGVDYFMYANETISIGKAAGCAGAGDCDDFAILMAALVESVGGTTRIILAHNSSTGGHAYAEVYLGRIDGTDSRVRQIIDWLRQKYDTDKIYTHIDTDTKDVWLNLDWGPDEKGNAHPGGPFYRGNKHIVLCIRDYYGKTPLKLPEGHAAIASAGSILDTVYSTAGTDEISKEIDGMTYRQLIAWIETTGIKVNIPVLVAQVAWDEGLITSQNCEIFGQCGEKMTASGLYSLGVYIFHQGEYDESVKYFDEAIRRDAINSTYWFDKGVALYYLERYDEALLAYDEAINIEPSNVNAWYNKGAILDKQGKLDEAIKAYDEALKLDSNNADIWYDKSIALDALGRNSEAKQASNEAIRLDPNYADPSYHVGFFSMQLYQERHLLVPGELL
jgi:tetratricopeptide (TPR) repeat protein